MPSKPTYRWRWDSKAKGWDVGVRRMNSFLVTPLDIEMRGFPNVEKCLQELAGICNSVRMEPFQWNGFLVLPPSIWKSQREARA